MMNPCLQDVSGRSQPSRVDFINFRSPEVSILEEKVANISRSTLPKFQKTVMRVMQDLAPIAYEDLSGNMIFSQVG